MSSRDMRQHQLSIALDERLAEFVRARAALEERSIASVVRQLIAEAQRGERKFPRAERREREEV